MRTDTYKTVQLGDLVVAAFDLAARYSTDPRKVSRMATRAVARLLRAREAAPVAFAIPARGGNHHIILCEDDRLGSLDH